MTFTKLSPKQKSIFRWCYKSDYKALICDGAVRSGKTICMITAFILWAMRKFDGATFGICGKTVRSAERNIIMPLQTIADITAYFDVTYTRSVNLLTVKGMGKTNKFYVFGGKDESSYMLIQGSRSAVFFLMRWHLCPVLSWNRLSHERFRSKMQSCGSTATRTISFTGFTGTGF